ncbi:hypothetical protein P3T16_001832 [Paraburkholderia sp. GAS42]
MMALRIGPSKDSVASPLSNDPKLATANRPVLEGHLRRRLLA